MNRLRQCLVAATILAVGYAVGHWVSESDRELAQLLDYAGRHPESDVMHQLAVTEDKMTLTEWLDHVLPQ